jgi:hypothetical protein
MRLIDLTPLHEIDFPNQKSFDSYNKIHKLRPDTKVTVAGRVTTAGRAALDTKDVKGTSVFGGDKKSDASLNGTSALNKSKPEDLVPSVTNHLNKVSGGDGFAQIDDGSGAIIYNMGDGDMPTYTLYMGKEGSKHRVSLEPTYGNDPKKLQGKIDKSFDNPKDAIKFMGDVAKRYRKELEMDDSKKSDTSLSSMIPNKATQKYDPATAFNQKVSKMTDNNDHSAAAVELAIYMDDKEAVQKLQQIKKLRDNRGYLRPSEAKERGEMVNNLLQRAQKELPKKDFDLISSAF